MLYMDIWVYIGYLIQDIFLFLTLMSFFLFGTQLPGMLRRFGAEVPTSSGFVAWVRSPLIACFGVRRYSMRSWRLTWHRLVAF